MECMDLERRIRLLECLLMGAKEDEQFGMVVYYQVVIEELQELELQINKLKLTGFNLNFKIG